MTGKFRSLWIKGKYITKCSLLIQEMNLSIADLETEGFDIGQIATLENYCNILWVNELFNFTPDEIQNEIRFKPKITVDKLIELLSNPDFLMELYESQRYIC